MRKKLPDIDALNADIVVIQECEDSQFYKHRYLDLAGDYLWIRTNRNKGLGVFPKNGSRVSALPWHGEIAITGVSKIHSSARWSTSDLKLFLPFSVNDNLTIFAVWTKGSDKEAFGYVGQLWKYLQIHGKDLSDFETVTGNVRLTHFQTNSTSTTMIRLFTQMLGPSRGITPVLFSATLLLIFTSNQPASAASNDQPLTVLEASIPEMQQAMASGQMTSRELVEQYLIRIALYEERVNAVIAVNPNALADADRLDAERAAGQVRGPLHGIPVALKDNIHTTDMPTTGGALVFRDFVPPYEATLTTNLRNAGAIIIAKTVMTELANFLGSGMPGNYSAIGGYGLNPYDPRRDPRQGVDDGRPVMGVGGSSSGIGTAMSFWAANVGTETSGSILSPANANRLAAIKPTVGRISRWGIIPITADQDTAGPMARSVTDAAILLGVLESLEPDPRDAATRRCEAPANNDYTPHLQADGLRGARIGIPRAFYYDQAQVPGSDDAQGGINEEARAVMAAAIDVLRQQGAIIVDPADIPSVIDPDPARNLLASPPSSVLSYGMKRDFNAWLASLGDTAPVSTLTQLREWNLANEGRGAIPYGQARIDEADALDLLASLPAYQSDRARDLFLSAEHGIDEVMAELNLDALLFPGSSGAGIAARAGYPTVIVPFSHVANELDPPLPEGFNAEPRHFGISFSGTACSEARLIELAYSFEQATRARIAPPDFP